MSDISENKPRRRRVVRGGEGLLATSNETKMKSKTRVVEKPATPLFSNAKTEKTENAPAPIESNPQEDIIQYANPLPLEEKPKARRGRQPKAKAAEPAVEATEETAPTAPEKKRRGRPKKQVVIEPEPPVEEVVEELMPAKKGKPTQTELFEETPVAEPPAEAKPTEVDTEKTKKGRRGRPKKKVAETPASEEKPMRFLKKRLSPNLPPTLLNQKNIRNRKWKRVQCPIWPMPSMRVL